MTSDLKIERGIPVPERRKRKYPFEDMQPGDSFEVPLNGDTLFRTRSRIQGSMAHFRTKGWSFTTRKTDTGIRVWRLS